MKEVHANFEDVARKLDLIYALSSEANNFHGVGAVVAIWTDICADVVLCKKLLAKGQYFRLVATTDD